MVVQDLFKNCDVELLLESLLKISCVAEEYIEELGRKKYLKVLEHTIDDFLKLKPVITEDYIYVAQHDDIDEIYLSPSIIHKEDLVKYKDLIDEIYTEYDKEKFQDDINKPISYSLMFIEREKLLGYQFSEYSLKKYDEYDVIASVFHELTFFGYDNDIYAENSKEELQELERRSDEATNHPENLISFEEAMEEIFGEDWDDIEVEMPSEEEIDAMIEKNTKETYEHYYNILKELA